MKVVDTARVLGAVLFAGACGDRATAADTTPRVRFYGRVLLFVAVILVGCSGESSAPRVSAAANVTVVNTAIGSTAAGFETADSVAIKVTDNVNNPIAGQAVTFSIVAGGGTVSAATKNTGVDGIARTSWTVGNAGPQTLRATAGSLHVDVTANAVGCREITLAVGEVQSLAPTDAACAILNGNAQRYFVTIVNPTNSPVASVAYRARGASGATSAQLGASVATSSVATGASAGEIDEEMQRALARDRMHALILEKNMEMLQRVGPQAQAALHSTTPVSAQRVPPAVGDLIPMKLPDITVDGCTVFTPVVARVAYVGTKAIILEDTENTLEGQVDTVYKRVGEEFDNVMFPILSTNFGNPLIMDPQLNNDGAMYMLFSTKVNTMGNGQIAGFVSNSDFFPTAQCPSSNVAETFYARSPTALGAGTSEPVFSWEFTRAVASTIIHEAKHLTSFAAKMAQPGFSGSKPPQDAWLEESSAELAQELLSRSTFSYAAKSNVDYAATIAKEVRPSSGMPFNMANAFRWLHGYVSDPESFSIVGATAAGDVNFYGGGWAFLRWAIDTYATSEPAFLTAMTRDISHFGVANIENLTGKSFAQLLSEFSLALALDDYPGFTPTDAKYSFPSWNLRNIFAGMSGDFQKSFANPSPLKVHSYAFGKFTVNVSGVRGGGFSLLELSGTQANKQLLEFNGVNGAGFPSQMRVSIVRVQ
jgi:hypothetical protein